MMTTKPKISVIIPVYNVEKWLNKCVDSILSQSYENFEVILVNDGSTDKSKDICDQYSKEDKRVKVFHNKNKGLSYSRNFGVKKSNGKYVMFVDSDDFISDINIIDKFINILEKDRSDFIYTSYCRFNDKNEDKITEILPIDINNNHIEGKSGIEILSILIEKNNYHHAAYLKICNRKFLIENNLLFKEGIYHEDAEWSPKLFYYAKRISIYNEPYYMRRMRENSIITTTNESTRCKKICDRLIIADDLIKFFEKENASKVIIDDLVRMYWGDLMITRGVKEKDNIKKCTKVIASTKNVLNKSSVKKYLIGNKLIKYLGAKNFINLLKIAGI